ncbi:MAG: histone deacetylase [Desulfobacteraceae bacterium]|nr:MAG: histone deacetylase [Desulfobacteraceae bacterium]
MILYDPSLTISMVPYGILIPLRDSRATKTFADLSEDPLLGSLVDRWHCRRVDETLTRQDLLRVHAPEYIGRLYGETLEEEILATYELIDAGGRHHRYAPEQAVRPLADLFRRILIKAAGTLQCARLALEHGFCFYFAGGMHHAHYDHGSGFCMINDIVIAARKLLAEGAVKQIWVIDVDAHKGDGTAALTAGDDAIATLSIHMANGWPLDGPALLENGQANPAFIPSDIDIGVAEGEEDHYLHRLEDGLSRLDRSGRCDLAVVVSGADPYEGDELPSTAGLKLSMHQMLSRDQLIYTFLRSRDIPAAYLMAGGYGEQVWRVYAQFLKWVLFKRMKAEG